MKYIWWLLPCLALLLFAPFSGAMDLALAKRYFDGEIFRPLPFSEFFYEIATYPALALGFSALLLLPLSLFLEKMKALRKPLLLLVLTMALGAGLIVHTLLKDHWGRPRPKQVVEFNGKMPFQPFYVPDFQKEEPARSFPCGHCTMGFYFFALGLIFQRLGWPKTSWFLFAFAICLGMAMGWARMSQGGHFFSDVLASGLIMWIVAKGLDLLIYKTSSSS